MENMSIDETLKKVLKYYPACPFMTADVLGIYADEGYDVTDRSVRENVSSHLATLYKQKYLKMVDTIRIGGVRHVYMVRP